MKANCFERKMDKILSVAKEAQERRKQNTEKKEKKKNIQKKMSDIYRLRLKQSKVVGSALQWKGIHIGEFESSYPHQT